MTCPGANMIGIFYVARVTIEHETGLTAKQVAGALALFILNYVAAISYPDLNIAGVKDHMLWGTMLAITFFHGPGKISIDYFVQRKLAAND